MQEIIDTIKRERMLQGMSLRKLSEITGIPYSSLSLIERGEKKKVTLHTIVRILDALGCTISVEKLSMLTSGKGADV